MSTSRPPPEARLSAALTDRYRVEGELGHGGMATVYLAQSPKHHRKVVIKVHFNLDRKQYPIPHWLSV